MTDFTQYPLGSNKLAAFVRLEQNFVKDAGFSIENYLMNDMTPFINIFNEFYAKDTSRKIRAVFKAKGQSGKPLCTNLPYGYLKDPEDKNHWIVDE